MSTTSTQPDEADDRETAKENSGQLQEKTGTVFGSFTNEDQEADSSIGSGTSDQGMNPEDQPWEDEFGDVNLASPGAGFNDGTNDAGGSGTMRKENSGHSKKPDHGLVEEGPGPDA